MDYISSTFSLLFFLGALISLFWGSYIIKLNLKSNMYRAFLLLCVALSIWSFGLAMANSSDSLANALFWIRFAALGWTFIFSINLHFLLLIANEKQACKLSKYLYLIHIPAWAMYYSARHYDVLDIKTVQIAETIISSEQQKKMFTNFSIGLCISGILAFSFEYFSSESGNSGDFKKALIKASILIILGLSISFIQRIKKESLKEMLTILVLVSSVPIVSFLFFNYSTITVWVYPMIIIFSSLLFNKRTLLISTTIVAIITQRLVWILKPESYVLVDKYDFILRIILLIAAFSLGLYINKTYIAKIKENDDQIAFQNMISDVLFEFVSFNQENFDEKVNYLLKKIGSFFDVDRTYLFTINHHTDTMTYSNEWCNKGIKKEVGTIEDIPLDTFPWWIDQLSKKNLVHIEDIDDLPEKANPEREQLLRQDIKSLISVPVMGTGKMHAFIGIDSVLEAKKWSEEKINLLKIMANILSSALAPIKTNKETEYMAYYDGLTRLPNRFLFADRVNQAIYLSKRTGNFLAIIFLDLDGFKSVNDTMGHKGGDILLKQIAQSLNKVIRKTDTVARFGGDEFMIMINNLTDYETITKIADKIMKIFSDAIIVDGQAFLVTASAGIAMYPADGENSDTLVKNADIAMYKAKSKGKNQYALYTKEMKEEIQINRELSNGISKEK